jgi:hypothetical protein
MIPEHHFKPYPAMSQHIHALGSGDLSVGIFPLTRSPVRSRVWMGWDVAGYSLKWCSGIITNRTLLEDEKDEDEKDEWRIDRNCLFVRFCGSPIG